MGRLNQISRGELEGLFACPYPKFWSEFGTIISDRMLSTVDACGESGKDGQIRGVIRVNTAARR